MSRPQDLDSSTGTQDGQGAEHHENQRHTADSSDEASEPDARPPPSATEWEVGEECVEFTVGPGCVQRFKPLFKLVPAEPPLGHRVI